MQLGHGGVYSLEAWSREHMARRLLPPLAPSPVPWWARFVHRGAHVLTTEEVAALARRFGQVAAWAREAGYDAVQLAGGNAKLLHQFLSPTYNRRDDRYGGLVEKRFQLFREIRKAVAEEAGEDYPVWLKFAATEIGRPFGGYGLDMGVAVAKLAEDAGFDALTPAGASVLPNTAICRGAYPSASFTPGKVHDKLRAFQGSALRLRTTQAGFWVASKRFPFRPVWNRSIFSAVKAAVRIPVFAVGGIRTREEAEDILARGEADMVGVGRPFYAEPALAEKISRGRRTDLREQQLVHRAADAGPAGVCYDPRVNERRRASAAKSPHIRQPA
ncbi:MAG: tRNA-dihydrouridine synthase [Deltaproteobacteria bacterium]|nr:tRNA-dihydrouridine synthase [Deltaproteobacteria bacterium]